MNVLHQAVPGRLMFRCPGCEDIHTVVVGSGEGPRWTWNNDMVRPTFQPSVLCTNGHYVSSHKPGDDCWCTYNAANPERPSKFGCKKCHSYITDGQIRFLDDCSHALKGQTVPLPAWEEPAA